MGDSVLTTTNTTSNRRQEPDGLSHDQSKEGFRGRFTPCP